MTMWFLATLPSCPTGPTCPLAPLSVHPERDGSDNNSGVANCCLVGRLRSDSASTRTTGDCVHHFDYLGYHSDDLRGHHLLFASSLRRKMAHGRFSGVAYVFVYTSKTTGGGKRQLTRMCTQF